MTRDEWERAHIHITTPPRCGGHQNFRDYRCSVCGPRPGDLEQLLFESVDVLRSVEWRDLSCDYESCPSCGHDKRDGHREDCRLAALIAAFKEAGYA